MKTIDTGKSYERHLEFPCTLVAGEERDFIINFFPSDYGGWVRGAVIYNNGKTKKSPRFMVEGGTGHESDLGLGRDTLGTFGMIRRVDFFHILI